MAEPISLDKFRKKKQENKNEDTIYGTLVWLSCPKCKKIEYTEIVAPNGRRHSCGTTVDEVEVELDLRAEATIARHNLERLTELQDPNRKQGFFRKLAKNLSKSLIEMSIAQEETYLQRLGYAAQGPLEPYEGDPEELKKRLPIAAVDPLGRWISYFFHQPAKRFQSTRED